MRRRQQESIDRDIITQPPGKEVSTSSNSRRSSIRRVSIYQELIGEFNELLEISLNFPAGATHSVLEKEKDLVSYSTDTQWLKEQLNIYSRKKIELEEDNDLEESIKKLEEELFNLKSQQLESNRVAKRVRQADLINKMLLSKDPNDQFVMKMLKMKDETVEQLMIEQKTEQSLDIERNQLQRDIREIRLIIDNLWTRSLLKLEKDSSSVSTVKKEKQLERMKRINLILRTVLHNMIFGSAIDWSEDTRLSQFLIGSDSI